MITKAIEIRDRCTFIAALAIKMVPDCLSDRYLLGRAGYDFLNPCVMLCRMDANGLARQASHDPYEWGACDRTYQVVHLYIIDHFDELESGAVVDVEFILGETKQPKKSEREG